MATSGIGRFIARRAYNPALVDERPPLPARIRTRADLDALLASATNYEEKLPRDPLKKALDLGRVRALFASVGDPQRGPRTLHVAGSKGKGSVARMLAIALRHARPAGEATSVGLYTSPHLEDLAERVEIDGRPVPQEALAAAADRVLPHVRRTQGTPDAPTFFEMFTAFAWVAFREAACTEVVLETGLGGRLDATNVCVPAATIITSIEREHTRLLGDTLEAIAGEKAGILKPGVPAFTLAKGGALETIRARAHAVGAPLQVLGEDFHLRDVRTGPGPWTHAALLVRDGTLHALALPVAGVHQAANAAVAFVALRSLGLEPRTIAEGLARVRLPGTLEPFGTSPVVVVDGAHTPASAEATRAAVARCWPDRAVVLLTALLEEKDLAGIARALTRDVRAVVATQVATPRAVPCQALADALGAATTAPVQAVREPAVALTRARALAGPDGLVLCSGSVYLAGAVRRLVREPVGAA
jgi:dihydrofolate synthase/folylpolyglutamate synthase